MANFVTLKNAKTGEIKNIKIGWSWTFFFLTGFFGIPLFIRRLYGWAALILAIDLITAVIGVAVASADSTAAVTTLNGINSLLSLIVFGSIIFLAIKGNEITVKSHLEHGWVFAEPNSKPALFLQLKWAMA